MTGAGNQDNCPPAAISYSECHEERVAQSYACYTW